MVSWFLGFKVPKIYQIAISYFLIDIDPVSKICKTLLDGSAGFAGVRFSKNVNILDFLNFEIYENNNCVKCPVDFS